jgi:uncharacterized protein with NRDE domain
MCICFAAFGTHPDRPLVLAFNRDEYYARPTAPAHFWEANPELLAGQDLQAGGTWAGVTRTGRFALLTNYRDPKNYRADAHSRGDIVTRYLAGQATPTDFLASLASQVSRYNPFNLILGSVQAASSELHYFSSRAASTQRLSPGLYALSNADLGTPWPKVRRGQELFELTLQAHAPPSSPALMSDLMNLLQDTHVAPDSELPVTGVGLQNERMLSPIFIESADYGTVSSTVLKIEKAGPQSLQARFLEVSYVPSTGRTPREFSFGLEAQG